MNPRNFSGLSQKIAHELTDTLYIMKHWHICMLIFYTIGTLVEEADDKWIPGISLRGLNKWYGDRQVVNNISCDFYEGQITVLLGHNGAAKTTTM